MDLADWLYEQFMRYPNNPQFGMIADDLWPLIDLSYRNSISSIEDDLKENLE